MGAIYFHSNHGRGRPRGTPLRGLGKIRKWEGRCGQGGGGMGPRMREDNGGDGRFANRPYGLLTTRASAAWGQSIFIAITGEGAHEGRPYGGWGAWEERGRGRDGSPHARGQQVGGMTGEGWVPACARTTGGGDDGGGMGPRMREDNRWGG